MRIWRLSSARRARDFDGGYGIANSGRWNTKGRAVTYCSTVPSLCALEKRVHVTDPGLLPEQSMVAYDLPDDVPLRRIELDRLAPDWTAREIDTQRMGDEWLDGVDELVLVVPSAIMPIQTAPDRNVLINHRHPRVAQVRIAEVLPFNLDPRLFDV
jgi:RES domain-containing protein